MFHLRRSSSLPGIALLASILAPAADYHVTGPYTHDNLSIYLLHGQTASQPSKLLTLQEAMDQHMVVVYETGQVNELSIENRSSLDVYIQSGDIVKGGRQDRTLVTDLVLPPHSGKVPIAAFCVEHGRWTQRGSEQAGQFSTSNRALPSKSLKLAVRDEQNQSKVWAEVARAQGKLSSDTAAATPSPTSMQLSLEDKTVVKQTNTYVDSLAKIIDGRDDVVGYAYVINGKLNSADVYASHDLFRRMWPKMLQASATEALSERTGGSFGAIPNAAAIRDALAAGDQGRQVSQDTAGRISVVKKESGSMVVFEADDRKAWIHKSYVTK
jgi:hypothetical protein